MGNCQQCFQKQVNPEFRWVTFKNGYQVPKSSSKNVQNLQKGEIVQMKVQKQLVDVKLNPKPTIQQQPKQQKQQILPQKLLDLLPQYIEQKRINITILDLNNPTNDHKDKLTEKQMEAFTKVQLPQVKTINIENHFIKDKGLQILCSKGNYPSLKAINLEDNGISINGVKNLLFNKWDKNVKYELSSVQENEGAFRLHVGQSIPLIKNIIEKKQTTEIDKLIPVQQNKKLNALNLLLATPFEDQSIEKKSKEQSKIIIQNFQADCAKNNDSVSHLMLAFKQCIGQSLHFTNKSGIKTKLATKIISTGIIGQRVKFSQRFEHLENFQFSDFKRNHKKIKQFQNWYFRYLRETFGIDTSQMTVDQIVRGSINAVCSNSPSKMLDKAGIFYTKIQQKDFFQRLELNSNQFDQNCNLSFPKISQASVQKRGGLPYYQPVLGKRFAIKVSKQYQNDDWLKMDGNKNEWAVGFHGITNPANKVVSNKTGKMVSIMRSIMDGRQQGNMLMPGGRQGHQNSICMKSNQRVGNGIFISPYFLTSLLYYAHIVPGSNYHIVLQCRAKPSSIKIISSTQGQEWVINKREDLRPYGVILFTSNDVQQLQRMGYSAREVHKLIYKEEFSSQSWRRVYEKQYKQFHSR